jgi:hypothetical protein
VQFESAKVLRLQPGDVVVLQVGHDLSEREYRDFTEQTQLLFPDHKIVVLGPGAELQVFRKD